MRPLSEATKRKRCECGHRRDSHMFYDSPFGVMATCNSDQPYSEGVNGDCMCARWRQKKGPPRAMDNPSQDCICGHRKSWHRSGRNGCGFEHDSGNGNRLRCTCYRFRPSREKP